MRTWRQAWSDALYGPGGFFTRESPADHFRTSVHASGLFAQATAALARRHNCDTVYDVGAGDGQLLVGLSSCAPELALVGVDLADRPEDLPDDVAWLHEPPDRYDGLVVANELLDDVPCTVAEVDAHGELRELAEDGSLGDLLSGPGLEWSARWWPAGEPGERVEVGLSRDDFWSDVVARLANGVAAAVDYGHVAGDRPPFGTLTSYREGRDVDLVLDGTADVTAHVAVDSVAAAVGGTLSRQRDVLADLGVVAARPSIEQATSDPQAYVRALSEAGEAAELTARGGLGDFWWIVTHR